MSKDKTVCPHCGQKMKKWIPPVESTWANHFQYVCFNDECPYYVKGWEWMRSEYNQNASYRHRYDPVSGQTGPLPVWSREAHRDAVVDE